MVTEIQPRRSEAISHLPPDAPVTPEVERQVQHYLALPYQMLVQGDPNEGYLALVPELPGCVTAGATPEEAIVMLRDAMAGWLTVAIEHGDSIPEPAPAPPQAAPRPPETHCPAITWKYRYRGTCMRHSLPRQTATA